MTPGNNWLSWMQEGDHYYQKGSYCEALSSYIQGLQMDPSNSLLLSKKGNTLYWLQQYEAADLSYAEALQKNNAVVLVYNYVLEHTDNLEGNLGWLQDVLHAQYQIEIISEGLTRVVHQVEQEILEQVNDSTTHRNHSFSWEPAVNMMLKQVGVPFAGSFLGLIRQLQRDIPQKSIGILRKKPVMKMTWQQFELFLLSFFEKQGYHVRKTKKSHDQGADLILERAGERVVVQAKKRKKTTGNKAVQEVHAARGYYQANRAMVISTSKFSKSATELADRLGVELWDWSRLLAEMNTH
jgi:tetratricopeptide (TPR) repeat protein